MPGDARRASPVPEKPHRVPAGDAPQGHALTAAPGTRTEHAPVALEAALDRIAAAGASHLTTGPSTEEELRALEASIGTALPPAVRAFLRRLGGGLFYQDHEVFGPVRLMIHDIELVPSVAAVRARIRPASPALARTLVPFHRAAGRLHLVDAQTGRVDSLPPGEAYADLTALLESVLAPADRR